MKYELFESIEEIIFDARTKGFSELIKRRFVLGSFILQKENQDKLFLNVVYAGILFVILFNLVAAPKLIDFKFKSFI